MKLKISDSIYRDYGNGLEVKGGRLINNRPDGMTGIAQMAANKKVMKKAEKIQMYSEAVALGNMKSEMMEGPEEM